MVFPVVKYWMWELGYKESWAPKNWCFWTVVLENTLESPLDSKEIKPVHPKGNQSWIFTGRADAEAEAPKLWPPDAKSWFIFKDRDAGKDWRWAEKGMTGWGGWMASLTQWTWVWVNSGRCWWTGRPGMLQSMGSQKVGHNWATELNWIYVKEGYSHTMNTIQPLKKWNIDTCYNRYESLKHTWSERSQSQRTTYWLHDSI